MSTIKNRHLTVNFFHLSINTRYSDSRSTIILVINFLHINQKETFAIVIIILMNIKKVNAYEV